MANGAGGLGIHNSYIQPIQFSVPPGPINAPSCVARAATFSVVWLLSYKIDYPDKWAEW